MREIYKSTVIMLVSAALIVIGCGCKDTNTSSGFSSMSDIVSFPDNVTVSFDKSKSFPQKCNVYLAERKIFSDEDFDGMFSGTPEKETNIKGFTLDFNNQHGFATRSAFGFYTDKGNQFDNAVSYFAENYGKESLDSSSNLSFAERDTVITEINKYMKKFEVSESNILVKNFYSITKEQYGQFKCELTKAAAEATGDDKEKIQGSADRANKIDEEDFYFLDLEFKVDEISVISERISSYGENPDDTIFGSTCSLVYTNSGVEFISLYHLYQPSESSNEIDVLETDEAQKCVADKYSDIFFDGSVEIYDMNLIYVPIAQNSLDSMNDTFLLKPCYVFSCHQIYSDDDYISSFKLYFDAETGKEIGTVR